MDFTSLKSWEINRTWMHVVKTQGREYLTIYISNSEEKVCWARLENYELLAIWFLSKKIYSRVGDPAAPGRLWRDRERCALEWLSTSRDFASPPGDIWQWLMIFLVVTPGRGRSATGIQWLEARYAAKHLMLQRTAPHKRELFGSRYQ